VTRRSAIGLLLGVVVAACGSIDTRRDVRAPADEVRFDFVRNQILVPVRIGARGPFDCTLDTGANPSVIDAAVARELGLPLSEAAGKAEGVGAADAEVRQTVFTVQVGDGEARLDAVTLDMAALSRGLGRPVHCVLGQNWLASRVTQIDYPARRLRFGSSATAPPGPGCAESALAFWMADDLMPVVNVEVNDIGILVSLDTGSSGTLKLFPDSAARVGAATQGAAERAVTGARGAAAVRTATIRSLRFGPLAGDDVTINVGNRNAGEPAGRDGNLGNGFLAASVLILDYPNRKIRVCRA
jgi:hypothetical protein